MIQKLLGVCATLLLVLLSGCASAKETYSLFPEEFLPAEAGFNSITEEELKDIVYVLANERLEGRRNGTKSSEIAGYFIEQVFWPFPFLSYDQDFYQDFDFQDVRNPRHANLDDIEALRLLGYEIETRGSNIVAILEGTTLKHEYIAVIAHRDHVGVQKGALHPGADDNASGTAALMEIAEAFGILSLKDIRPARSIIFAFFDAEEWGLWGSQYFVENPPVPLEQIVAVINLDMVGRNNPKELQVIGSENVDDFSERNPHIAQATNKANTVLNFRLVFPAEEAKKEKIFLRSDHASFFFACPELCGNNWPKGQRIPVVFFTTGHHKEYHTPEDTADDLNYEKLRNISRFAFLVAWDLANISERPIYNED